MICVSIGNKTLNEIGEILHSAELAEIRFDLCDIPIELPAWIFEYNCKTIATYRKKHGLSDLDRIKYLIKSIESGAGFIDLDTETDSQFAAEIIDFARQSGCSVIISRHNHDNMEIQDIKSSIDSMLTFGPDIVKIVFNPGNSNCIDSVRRAYSYFEGLHTEAKLICFGMGESAKESRIESYRLGAPFIYACPDGGSETAPGQFTFSEVKQILSNIKKKGTKMNFGHRLKTLWNLESDLLFLNHGSFGATPKQVLEAEWEWERKMERDPMHFFLDEYNILLARVIKRLAEFVNADARKLVLVDNATTGVCTVLRSELTDKPENFTIAYTNHIYPAVKKIIEYTAKVNGYKINEIYIPFPLGSDEEIMNYYRKGLSEGPGIAVLDHISFGPGVIFPIKEMIDYSRQMGYMTLVDAAHAPGMIPLNVEELKPDWYVGNCHKWMFTPKGCAMLWADTHVQDITTPLTISHFYGEGFSQGFGWTGTRNPAPWLALGNAIDFINSFGHENIYKYNHNLIIEGSSLIAEYLGVKPAAPGDMLGFLAPIEFPGEFTGAPQESSALRAKLYKEHNAEAVFNYLDGKMWLRITAQIYNELNDYKRLAEMLKSIR